MALAIASGDLYQWGREATKGTAVAATSKIAIEEMAFEPLDEVHRPRLVKGLAVRSPGNEFALFRGTRWTARGYAEYEQLQNWLEMSVVGSVTPTGTGPYVWTYTRNPAADPALRAYTLERRVTDLTNHIDNEWAYALATGITLSAGIDEAVRLEAEGLARRIQASTLTAAQALPTIEEPPIALTKIYIDSTWAGLGTTQIVAQALDWSVKFSTGVSVFRTVDGRVDQDFTVDVINGGEVGLDVEIGLLIKADSGQYAVEKTAAEAQTLRAVRIQADGGSGRQIQIDMLLKHVGASLFTVEEQDGARIVRLRLQESTDGTNLLRVKLTNNTSALV